MSVFSRRPAAFFSLACGLLCSLLLSGCAAPAPADARPPARLGLRLAPAALGATLSLQQHLKVERGIRTDELDTALEIDQQQLTLVGLAAGQRVMTLHFDGADLQIWRHPMLPAQVRGEDVLEDIQLTLWPVAAIRAALPPGWTLQEEGQGETRRRILRLQDEIIAQIDYPDGTRWGGTVVLNNLRYGYRLTILSVGAAP